MSDTELPPAVDVVEALSRVMAELGGIEKLDADQRRRMGMKVPEKGVAYAYRGIDQITSAIQPLLAKHGVVIVPAVTDCTTTDRPNYGSNGGWTDTFITVNWHICGPNNSRIEACTSGWGLDNSDKGVNKATTQAFKNLLLKMFCVGDPSDDTDGEPASTDNGYPSEPADPVEQTAAQLVALKFSRLDSAGKQEITKQAKEIGVGNVMRAGAKAAAVDVLIEAYLLAPDPEAPAGGIEG